MRSGTEKACFAAEVMTGLLNAFTVGVCGYFIVRLAGRLFAGAPLP